MGLGRNHGEKQKRPQIALRPLDQSRKALAWCTDTLVQCAQFDQTLRGRMRVGVGQGTATVGAGESACPV